MAQARQVEVRTRTVLKKGKDPEVLMAVNLLPRGSGNRTRARVLAKGFKDHPVLGPHILRISVGASRVNVYFRPSLQLWAEMSKMALAKSESQDVPGQLALF